MEMSWFVLAPTIFIAVILAAVILLKPGAADRRINFRKGVGEAAQPSNPLPTLSIWLRNVGSWLGGARQPVSPIDYSDLSVRARRGIKVAAVVVIVALLAVGQWVNDGGWAPVVIMIAAIPFAAIGSIVSVTHTLLLRMLPYRGPIVSTALGALLGIAAAYVLRNAMLPRPAVIFAGVTYGFIIGIIELSIAQEKAEQSQNVTVS